MEMEKRSLAFQETIVVNQEEDTEKRDSDRLSENEELFLSGHAACLPAMVVGWLRFNRRCAKEQSYKANSAPCLSWGWRRNKTHKL